MNFEPFFAVKGFRRILVFLGLFAIIGSMALFVGSGLEFIPKGFLSVFGQSDLRSMASIAVAGCLLVAFGYGHH